jgi:hypothetical protein
MLFVCSRVQRIFFPVCSDSPLEMNDGSAFRNHVLSDDEHDDVEPSQ